MKRIILLSLIAMLSMHMHGQQIGEIDLSRHDGDSVEVQNQNPIPDGCGMPHAVHGDGVVLNPDPNKQSKLKIEVALLNDTFKRGEAVEGKVLIQNVGVDTIEIPWSTDSRVSIRSKDASEYAYEMGWFELKLKGTNKSEVPLESESQSHFLYGSLSKPEAA